MMCHIVSVVCLFPTVSPLLAAASTQLANIFRRLLSDLTLYHPLHQLNANDRPFAPLRRGPGTRGGYRRAHPPSFEGGEAGPIACAAAARPAQW
jgi:hypothetical protein